MQQIRLICNVITPDNFEKKFKELRHHTFGDLKLPTEKGFDPNVDRLTEVSQENLDLIVERIFSKAQTEHDYSSFYGDLVEKMIRTELNLRGYETKMSLLKHSNFRKTLLQYCKASFDKIFEQDEEAHKTHDEEKLLKFKHRLLGNIKFVGELNRRNLL